jgi:hypothetical protein
MKTVAWDVDDTLNSLTREWLDNWWSPRRSGAAVRFEQLAENPPHRLLGVAGEEYLASLDAFRLSEQATRIVPVPEVMRWFHEHGDRARHLALTATPIASASASAAWVMKYYGTWIRAFNFVPSPRMDSTAPVYDSNKTAFLRWFEKVDILVEDNPEVLAEARNLGIQTVEIPQPWNNSKITLSASLKHLADLILEG